MKKLILFIFTFCSFIYANTLDIQVVSSDDILIANINQNSQDSIAQNLQTSNDNIVVMPLEVMVDNITIPDSQKSK